jgi:NADP-dependent alcohol dehydrogenase
LNLRRRKLFGGSALFPKFSICDPTVINLAKRQLQNGVVDAYTMFEQYLYPHEGFSR